VKIRLTRKLAECIDGVDLRGRRVGDLLDLPPHEARLLIAHGWAGAAEPGGADPPAPSPRRVSRPSPLFDPPVTVRVPLSKKDEPT